MSTPSTTPVILLFHERFSWIICSAAPNSQWCQNVPDGFYVFSDVLKEAAIYASKGAMEILTVSSIECVDYQPDALDFLFHEYRDDSCSSKTGESQQEEDLVAFCRLLEAKGNAIETEQDGLPLVSSTLAVDEPEVNEGNGPDVYEDALEHIDRPSVQQGCICVAVAR
jgi:hypothetical protein